MVSVDIQGLSKNFGSIHALNGVSLKVDEPSVLGILGPNGAGKTTMLKIITGILRPSTGNVLINGRSVKDDIRGVLAHVGSLIEEPHFYPYLTGYETLRFVSRIRGFSKKETDGEIQRVARITSCTSYLDRKTGAYSRGMRQRLGIAAALVGDPDVLVLDEPTTGLDPKGMKEIREIIRKISREGEHIVVLSTHLLNEAREVCDRVTIINQGSVAYDSNRFGDGTMVTVRASHIPGDLRLSGAGITDFTRDGDRLVLHKSAGTDNHGVVKYLIDSGVHVEEVSNYDDLEDTYISIVGDSGSD